MARRRLLITVLVSVSSLVLAGAGLAGSARAASGYARLHTDVHLIYDATANKFLPGNHVVLTDRATKCLTSFSLDFERTSANMADGPPAGRRSPTA